MAKKSHKKSKKKTVGKKNTRPARPKPPRDNPDMSIPSYDLLEDFNLEKPWDVQELVDIIVRKIKSGDFLRWEAVMCEEQGLPLTDEQEDALDELLSFDDPDDDILYIDGLERPNALWHEIVREIIPYFVNDEPFDTLDWNDEYMDEIWPPLFDALKNHTAHLSLPEGAESAMDIVDPGVLHQIILRSCLGELGGLGQEEDLTLENEEQQDRVDAIIDYLRQHKDMVRHFNLTLDSLLTNVIMPAKEEELFRQMMTEKLNLPSPQALLLDFL